MATTRLQQDELVGPDGVVVKVSCMPGGRLRQDFMGTRAVVTKIFPKGDTHLEISYSKSEVG